MITNVHLWIESNEREFVLSNKTVVTYGNPRSYYKVNHYTDKLLKHLSYASMKLWHHSLDLLSSSRVIEDCVTVRLHHEQCKELLAKNSFYKAVKELVRYRLLLETDKPNVYVVNIQYACKLNSPGSYENAPVVAGRLLEYNNKEPVDNRLLVF
jgi:hypothetical protein